MSHKGISSGSAAIQSALPGTGVYCELTGMTLHDFMDEEGDISDEKLIDAINEEMEAEWEDDWE